MRRLLVPVALVLFGAVVAAVAANVVRVLDATKGYETRPRLLLLSGAWAEIGTLAICSPSRRRPLA